MVLFALSTITYMQNPSGGLTFAQQEITSSSGDSPSCNALAAADANSVVLACTTFSGGSWQSDAEEGEDLDFAVVMLVRLRHEPMPCLRRRSSRSPVNSLLVSLLLFVHTCLLDWIQFVSQVFYSSSSSSLLDRTQLFNPHEPCFPLDTVVVPCTTMLICSRERICHPGKQIP